LRPHPNGAARVERIEARAMNRQTDAKAPARAEQAPEDMAAPEAFSPQDVETIEDRSRLRAPMIYEVVRREGEEEMSRPAVSLWWSGVAAGLSISFSLLTEAMLQMYLPHAPWRQLITSLGYPVGFLMVVLARQQLFTENTIRAVLPLAADFSTRNLGLLGRMWGIVFAANMAGTLVSAAFCTFTPVLTPGLRAQMLQISQHMMASGFSAMFFKAIAAGFLIAAMVWLIPNAEAAQFHVVTLMTYLISLGGFAHVVAGSVEAFLLLLNGQLGLAHLLYGFTAPVLLGNVVGGTALFAVISYAQIMKEV
jgi:formate/nitrite transporter FocA (FNT family)